MAISQFTQPVPSAPRAAIYVRVSSSKQEDEGTSLATQEASCRASCAERGFDVVAVFSDTHTGSELFERPALSALRERIRAGEVDVVVAHALDRLSRHQAHLGLILSECDHAGATLAFVTEALDDTPEGRLLQSVRAYAAEIERLKITERTQRGRAERLRSGKPHAGPRPLYGYQWVEEKHPRTGKPVKTRLAEHPETAPIVRRIFREIAAGGSACGVGRRLTAEGIPTPTGKAYWHPVTVTLIVRHPAYVGDLTARRWRTERVPGRGPVQSRRPVEEQVVLPDAAPALVSRELAEAAASRLASNRQAATRNNRRPSEALLRGGYVRCATCGGALHVENHPTRGALYRHSRQGRARHGCTDVVIAAADLDPLVWQGMRSRLLDPDLIGAELDRLRREDPTRADLAVLDRRMGDVERRQRTLVRRLGVEEDDDIAALIRAELAAVIAERKHLEAERVALEQQRASWEDAQHHLADLERWVQSVAGKLDSADYATRRLALDALAVDVRLWPIDHAPRWGVSMRLGIAETSTSSCKHNLVAVLRWTDRDVALLAAD